MLGRLSELLCVVSGSHSGCAIDQILLSKNSYTGGRFLRKCFLSCAGAHLPRARHAVKSGEITLARAHYVVVIQNAVVNNLVVCRTDTDTRH